MKKIILLLLICSQVAGQSPVRGMMSQFTPSLFYDFTRSATLPADLSYTGSGGTIINSSGLVTAAITNTARYEYDPATLTLNGLVVEDNRTNYIPYSTDATNGSWNKYNSSVTSGGATGKRNAATSRLIESGSSTSHVIYLTVTTSSTNVVTASVLMKQGTRRYGALKITRGGSDSYGAVMADLQTGTITQAVSTGAGDIPAVAGSIRSYGGGWYRVTVTNTYSGNGTSYQMGVGTSNAATGMLDQYGDYGYGGDNASYIDIDCMQLEVGSGATSIVNTTGSSATRAADVVTRSTTGWYRAGGTLHVIPAGAASVVSATLQLGGNTVIKKVRFYQQSRSTAYLTTLN